MHSVFVVTDSATGSVVGGGNFNGSGSGPSGDKGDVRGSSYSKLSKSFPSNSSLTSSSTSSSILPSTSSCSYSQISIKSYVDIPKCRICHSGGEDTVSIDSDQLEQWTPSEISSSAKKGSSEVIKQMVINVPHRNPALISPCRCRGSIRFVHHECLTRWLTMSSTLKFCELCRHPFNMSIEYPSIHKVLISKTWVQIWTLNDLLTFSVYTNIVERIGFIAIRVAKAHM